MHHAPPRLRSRPVPRTLALALALVLALPVLVAAPAHAQRISVEHVPLAPSEPPPGVTDIHDFPSFGRFFLGALTGFLAHESGHVMANLVQGNVPHLQGIWGFGFIPFFTVAPRIQCVDDHCTKHDGSEFSNGVPGKIFITSAGFDVQHLTDEIMLTRTPRLRRTYAPYRKGLFAFNTLLSLAYATTAITHIENPEGDVSSSAKLMGIPREVYALSLATVAGLDLVRYCYPDNRWVPWVSRAGKATFIGVLFAL